MPLARASELDRLFSCIGSTYLPQSRDVAGLAAQWGTKVHSWVETGLLPEDRDGELLGRKIDKSGTSRRKLWPEEGDHELAMAYDVLSGTVATCVVPPGKDKRDYQNEWKSAFDDRWIVGTLDFAMELLGRPWVDDLKTGRSVDWRQYAGQQSMYCLMYTGHKYGEIRDCRSTLTHWPKYPIANPPRRIGSDLSVDYLQGFKHKLVQLRDDILGARSRSGSGGVEAQEVNKVLSYGAHCRFCPSRAACPKFGQEQARGMDNDYEGA